MIFDGERGGASGAKLLPIFLACRNAQDPVGEPVFEVFGAAGALVILSEEGVIAAVIALHRRGMCGSGFVDYRSDEKSGD